MFVLFFTFFDDLDGIAVSVLADAISLLTIYPEWAVPVPGWITNSWYRSGQLVPTDQQAFCFWRG